MYGRKTLNRHASLMNRMAQVLGINLTEMMIRGKISGDEWREAVVRCASCSEPGECLHWLAEHAEAGVDRNAAPMSDTPGYCTNRMMMARLRHQRAEDELATEVAQGG
ncbi:hypothetical protein C8J27_102132 [Rhodobacter aestuarii]|uniref:DUF6455 domain-containing protein n=1 Tax=Rhodobacter aestuarii TaxID=453582 RepID=A0A1N7NAT9_9RHOB|nr:MULTISPECIES: DUF6455 family protein [Rhodobacter]PTV96338.1 hypothetical protein C8J27_102132 [Rhodobacter aestuarii]SIS95331.1 hypothetical protein SAMN05421580_107132 [Rhodobacter aestuarii]SOB92797.1 hypothetical protein SAMN05877809_101601 [Rhodobacter sp. JA431]